MTEFVLVRHGQTEWNRDGKLQGWADPALNTAGQRQARKTGKWLAERWNFDAVYASDLTRAVETVELTSSSA